MTGKMKNLRVSQAVLEKLKNRHKVSLTEVEHAFANRKKGLLTDTRAQHATDPPTVWFIACTNHGRMLKIVYIQQGLEIHVKSAFEPNEEELRIYEKYA